MRKRSSKWKSIPVYWYLIGGLLAVTAVLFINHLITGSTPDRTIFTIPFLNLDVYWYGICIVGGIALGAYVVSKLAEERAIVLFEQAVPTEIRKRPLSRLNLPKELSQKLNKHKIKTTGELLLQWGYAPANLRLKDEEMETVSTALTKIKKFNPIWLTNAPWRIWNPDHTWNGVMWGVVFGIIGARLYHVLTPSPSMGITVAEYLADPAMLLNFRNGGLGIYGGIAGGLLGVGIYTRRARIPFLGWADLAVIGMALGQVFGRWGNFFNQELYGKPTDLPWAIAIDTPLPDFAAYTHFHPAFLYESLWNLFAFLVLYSLNRRYSKWLLTGDLLAFYLILYAIGRTLLETTRLDSRMVTIGDMQVNMAVATLLSIILAIMMAGWRFMVHRKR